MPVCFCVTFLHPLPADVSSPSPASAVCACVRTPGVVAGCVRESKTRVSVCVRQLSVHSWTGLLAFTLLCHLHVLTCYIHILGGVCTCLLPHATCACTHMCRWTLWSSGNCPHRGTVFPVVRTVLSVSVTSSALAFLPPAWPAQSPPPPRAVPSPPPCHQSASSQAATHPPPLRLNLGAYIQPSRVPDHMEACI